jgi:glycosyltransferase involved in cell wall biosynthesis
MRICLLADAQSAHTSRWTGYLAGCGHDLHVLSFRPAELPDVRVHVFQWGKRLGKARYLLYPLAIRRLVHRLCPHILHAHHATSYGLAGALSGWRPFLIHTWGSDVLDLGRFGVNRKLAAFNLRRADVITCTSQVMARATRQLVPATTPVHLIPFGVDLRRFHPRPEPRPPHAPLVIGAVKWLLVPLYGLHHLLRAFAALDSPNRALQLLILGDGPQRPELESLARALGIAERTRFVGRVPNDQVVRYLHQMDIFVIPSLQESFGVAAVEASAVGLPVVASNVGGLPEVVLEGETGFLVPPADVQGLSERLAWLIADPQLRRRMGSAGRAFVTAHYDWQTNAAQMEHLYRSLVGAIEPQYPRRDGSE